MTHYCITSLAWPYSDSHFTTGDRSTNQQTKPREGCGTRRDTCEGVCEETPMIGTYTTSTKKRQLPKSPASFLHYELGRAAALLQHFSSMDLSDELLHLLNTCFGRKSKLHERSRTMGHTTVITIGSGLVRTDVLGNRSMPNRESYTERRGPSPT
jgi:hypothetical protein